MKLIIKLISAFTQGHTPPASAADAALEYSQASDRVASVSSSPRDIEIDGVLINAIGRLDDVCPSCGSVLDRRPRRTLTCPHCSSTIHVRRRVYDGQQVLMSPAEAAICDLQNKAFYDLKSFLRIASDSPRLARLVDEMGTLYAQAEFDWAAIDAYFSSTSTIHFRGSMPGGDRPH